jgi:hypothetical protein
MRIRPVEGDVFLVPLDKVSVVGGQVIAIREEEELYIAIFSKKINTGEIDPQTAIEGDPAFLTLSFDAKLANGDWPIIGNLADRLERYPDIAFKVKHSGVISVESRGREFRRPATDEEIKILSNRSIASPAIIEDAAKAYFGYCPWNEAYVKRLSEYAIRTAKIR